MVARFSWLGFGPLNEGTTTANPGWPPCGGWNVLIGGGIAETCREVASPYANGASFLQPIGRPGFFLGGFKASSLAFSSSRRSSARKSSFSNLSNSVGVTWSRISARGTSKRSLVTTPPNLVPVLKTMLSFASMKRLMMTFRHLSQMRPAACPLCWVGWAWVRWDWGIYRGLVGMRICH